MITVEEHYTDIENWSWDELKQEEEVLYVNFNAKLLKSDEFERMYAIINNELHRRRNKEAVLAQYERAMKII